MDFEERIFELAKRVRVHRDKLDNEQMTKNTLVMPFIQALGYDVFNPAEVVPEFSAPIGEYKEARGRQAHPAHRMQDPGNRA